MPRCSNLDVRFTDLDSSSIPNDEIILLEQSRKLYESWNKFRKVLPNDQRQDLDKQPPNMRYLFDSVQAASKTWQQERNSKRSGRLKKIFADLCRNCRDHSTLLSVIPSDDKYICLLTGSLAAIAQVHFLSTFTLFPLAPVSLIIDSDIMLNIV